MLYHLTSHILQCIAFYFFNDPATTEIYTLSLHDALPIWTVGTYVANDRLRVAVEGGVVNYYKNDSELLYSSAVAPVRSEEHTSELQSRRDLVCRLLLEKKKNNRI